MLVIVGSGSYETLLELLVPVVLALYALVVLALLVLRIKKPDHERPFRLKGAFVLGGIAIIFLFSLIVLWALLTHDAITKIRIIMLMLASGIPVYYLLLFTYDPDAVGGCQVYRPLISYSRGCFAAKKHKALYIVTCACKGEKSA